MSSDKTSGSPLGSSAGSTSTSTFSSSSSGTATPNLKNSKKWKISMKATSSNETIDDSPGFKKIEPLNISTEPTVKEYKKNFSATQLARNREKEQKERKEKQGKTKG